MAINELINKIREDEKVIINGKVYLPVKTISNLTKKLKEDNATQLSQKEVKYKLKYEDLYKT